MIAEQNSQNDGLYRLGLNRFSDMTEEEKSKYLGLE